MKWLALLVAAIAVEHGDRMHRGRSLRALTKARARLHRPKQYLLISSPGEMKICFTELIPGKTMGSTVKPVIDSGLVSPMGLAVDRLRGKLYVADPGSKKIFQYGLRLRHGQVQSDLRQRTMVENTEAQWVAVDQKGSLYYTDPLKKGIFHVDVAVIERLESEMVLASQLQTVSEATEAAQAQLVANQALTAGAPTPPPPLGNTIDTLFSQADGFTSVSGPSGLATDGMSVYWGNEQAGTTHGSIIEGARQRDGSTGKGDRSLSTNTNTVFGVTSSANGVFYTDNSQFVYGVKKAGGSVATMTDALQKPRGLAWDGDGTIFVADQAGSMVYSFPSGRLGAAAVSRVTTLNGAFGLALLQEDDAFVFAQTEAEAVVMSPMQRWLIGDCVLLMALLAWMGMCMHKRKSKRHGVQKSDFTGGFAPVGLAPRPTPGLEAVCCTLCLWAETVSKAGVLPFALAIILVAVLVSGLPLVAMSVAHIVAPVLPSDPYEVASTAQAGGAFLLIGLMFWSRQSIRRRLKQGGSFGDKCCDAVLLFFCPCLLVAQEAEFVQLRGQYWPQSVDV